MLITHTLKHVLEFASERKELRYQDDYKETMKVYFKLNFYIITFQYLKLSLVKTHLPAL